MSGENKLDIRSPGECKYDIVSLGEVMLRLDPGDMRIHTARQFKAWEGGGEYNVARGLKRCFGKNAAIVTAIADNPIGKLLEDLIYNGGVSMEYVKWVPYDGIGRNVRNGLNFTERGYGVRAAQGCSDRGHTAVSQLKPGDINWDTIFGEDGVRWFHTGGIFAALSESASEVAQEACEAAQRHGTIVSYDLNYRPSLWKGIGGKEKAQQVNKTIARSVDVMIGNEEDFTACLGLAVPGLDENITHIETDSFKEMIKSAVETYPNFQAVATTLRNARTATFNDWSAIVYHDGEFHQSISRDSLEILDRVGGGDSFASGLIYGFIEGKSAEQAVNYGAAHGAIAMTTPGDTTTASLREVEKVMQGAGARVDR